MKNYKYLRVLVCLLLVCCLIVNVSPIKAHALGPEWFFHQIGTDIGATGILEGLGLFRDALNGDEYYNDLVSDVKDYLADSGLCTLEYMDAYWRIDPVNANPVLTIPLALISAVRNYIFDNGVVKTSSDSRFDYSSDFSVNGKSGSVQSFTPFSLVLLYMPIGDNFFGSVYAYSTEDFDAYLNGSGVGNVVKYDYYYATPVFSVGSVPFPIDSNIPSYSFESTNEFTTIFDSQILPFNPRVVTDKPISLGYVGLPTFSFTSAYPQWIEHQKEEEDGSTAPMVQIGLGNTVGETESLTQEQIWSGQGTVSVPDQGQVSDSVILPGWLQQGIENLRLGLKDILDSLISLPVSIAKAIADIFIPSKDYISAKVEAIRGEFGFIDSVIATGEFIRDSISGASGPPVIYVDLGRAPSGNYGSQRVLLTDFSWYAPYKGQVDTVLSAALWAFFGWRVFLKLPGIIGGESGYISDVFFPSSSGRSGSDDKKKGGKG